MGRNGDAVNDKLLDRQQQRLLSAATRQLEQAILLDKNCQVVFNIAKGGRAIKAKITLDIDIGEGTDA